MFEIMQNYIYLEDENGVKFSIDFDSNLYRDRFCELVDEWLTKGGRVIDEHILSSELMKYFMQSTTANIGLKISLMGYLFIRITSDGYMKISYTPDHRNSMKTYKVNAGVKEFRDNVRCMDMSWEE